MGCPLEGLISKWSFKLIAEINFLLQCTHVIRKTRDSYLKIKQGQQLENQNIKIPTLPTHIKPALFKTAMTNVFGDDDGMVRWQGGWYLYNPGIVCGYFTCQTRGQTST